MLLKNYLDNNPIESQVIQEIRASSAVTLICTAVECHKLVSFGKESNSQIFLVIALMLDGSKF